MVATCESQAVAKIAGAILIGAVAAADHVDEDAGIGSRIGRLLAVDHDRPIDVAGGTREYHEDAAMAPLDGRQLVQRERAETSVERHIPWIVARPATPRHDELGV